MTSLGLFNAGVWLGFYCSRISGWLISALPSAAWLFSLLPPSATQLM